MKVNGENVLSFLCRTMEALQQGRTGNSALENKIAIKLLCHLKMPDGRGKEEELFSIVGSPGGSKGAQFTRVGSSEKMPTGIGNGWRLNY